MNTDITNNRRPSSWRRAGRRGRGCGRRAAADRFAHRLDARPMPSAPAPLPRRRQRRPQPPARRTHARRGRRLLRPASSSRSRRRSSPSDRSGASATISQDMPDDPLFREFFGDRFGPGRAAAMPERARAGSAPA